VSLAWLTVEVGRVKVATACSVERSLAVRLTVPLRAALQRERNF
jgi:hypothetical protein